MLKNQKLGLVAIASLVAGFGIWYWSNNAPQAKAAPPISMTRSMNMQERAEKQARISNQEIPEGQKKVEKALDERWGDMGEEVLTAPSINAEGQTVFFDKSVVSGLRSDGSVAYAQGAHRSYVIHGPVIRELSRKPITVSVTGGKLPGKGFFLNALKSGKLQEKGGKPPAVKVPAASDQ